MPHTAQTTHMNDKIAGKILPQAEPPGVAAAKEHSEMLGRKA